MRHILFQEADTYKVALLVKANAFKPQELRDHYVTPLVMAGLPSSTSIAFNLKYNEVGKAPAKFVKDYLDKLLPALNSLGVEYLYVTDANYFKVLTKQAKAEPHYGYILPCQIKGYEHMHVVLGLNYQALIYNPVLQTKLDMSLATLANHILGQHQVLGANIIHSSYYPRDTESIAAALQALHAHPRLTCDIETFSLRFNEAGIGTVAFAWDQHNGIAFPVDFKALPVPIDGMYGEYVDNREVKKLLKAFFTTYKGEITWHNGVFDIKIIIYELWMKTL